MYPLLQTEIIAPTKEIRKIPGKVESQKKLPQKPNTRFPTTGVRQKIDEKSDAWKKPAKTKKKPEGKERGKKKGAAQKPDTVV